MYPAYRPPQVGMAASELMTGTPSVHTGQSHRAPSALLELALSVRAAVCGSPAVAPALASHIRAWLAARAPALAEACSAPVGLPAAFAVPDDGDLLDGLCQFAFLPRDRVIDELRTALASTHAQQGRSPAKPSALRALLSQEIAHYAEDVFGQLWNVYARALEPWFGDGTVSPLRSALLDEPLELCGGSGDAVIQPLAPEAPTRLVSAVRVPLPPPALVALLRADRAMHLLLIGAGGTSANDLARWGGADPRTVRNHLNWLLRAGLVRKETERPPRFQRTPLGDALAAGSLAAPGERSPHTGGALSQLAASRGHDELEPESGRPQVVTLFSA